MTEHGCIEAKPGELPLAAPPFLGILKADRITEPDDVHADIASNQKTLPLPKERDVARTMAGRVGHP